MTQELLSGLNGYNIPCRHTIQGGESMVCLITHGFGSSKDSPTAQLLAGELPRHGIGTLGTGPPRSRGQPGGRGRSEHPPLPGRPGPAEARALELAPGARVVYFSSSFGAYLNLIYLSTRPHRGTRSFLRSAAVEMPLLFHTPTPEQAEELARQGFLMLDQGYVRPLKLTPAFLADLDAHDLFQLYRSGEERVCMIHGDEDQTASPEAARRFAQTFGARLIQVPGGDHSLSGPGMPQLVVREALEFYLAP